MPSTGVMTFGCPIWKRNSPATPAAGGAPMSGLCSKRRRWEPKAAKYRYGCASLAGRRLLNDGPSPIPQAGAFSHSRKIWNRGARTASYMGFRSQPPKKGGPSSSQLGPLFLIQRMALLSITAPLNGALPSSLGGAVTPRSCGHRLPITKVIEPGPFVDGSAAPAAMKVAGAPLRLFFLACRIDGLAVRA